MSVIASQEKSSKPISAELYVKRHDLPKEALNTFAGGIEIKTCTFDGNGGFEFDESGELAAVIGVVAEDGQTVVDLVAWPIDRPEVFTTLLGVAGGLGISNVTNPGTWSFGKVLHVQRTPLAWLKGGCEGVCILDHRHVSYWLGAALGDILVEDEEHATEITAMLNPRFKESRILVPASSTRQAT